ncbi:conserved hypothetical protein [Microsporum canis CBS 113480]|uniref:Uncharacterized protein n=1 Tax=Arthroderma otae (strain ATCC MYA-4605 / CBS 113480) TaxID=554155 RepID=C5FVS5_ARTOC|nr:conserved hypothetical protein [Microsporum canis CBS 113480]EEQ34009.1 conserved hypothetical protein [Microsporum canis CBS 113480]
MATLSLRLPSLEDGDPWIVHQKLFGILSEYLQPASSTAPSAAAKEIDSLTPKKRQGLDASDDAKPKEDYESFLLEIWNSLIEVARQIPSDHASQDRLVELVKALRELPSTNTDRRERWYNIAGVYADLKAFKNTVRVWTDLPLLGPAMREAWIGPPSGNAHSSNDAQRWVNQNAFAARLLNLDQIFWSNFAVWSLRSALEEPPAANAESHRCNVEAAAQWMVYSGPYLLKEANEDPAREAEEQEAAKTEAQPNRGQPLAAGKYIKPSGDFAPNAGNSGNSSLEISVNRILRVLLRWQSRRWNLSSNRIEAAFLKELRWNREVMLSSACD